MSRMRTGYQWVEKKDGSDLYYSGLVVGSVRPNSRTHYVGSPNQGWFWWAGLDPMDWDLYGLQLTRTNRADLKLPKKVLAMAQLMEYCNQNLIIKEHAML